MLELASTQPEPRVILDPLECMEDGEPTIHTDRSVGHLFEFININSSDLKQFYESLPHEGKYPLEEVDVVLGGFAYYGDSGRRANQGELDVSGRSMVSQMTPPSPEQLAGGPRINLQLGVVACEAALLGQLQPDKDISQFVQHKISESITHELVHVAQLSGLLANLNVVGDQHEDQNKKDELQAFVAALIDEKEYLLQNIDRYASTASGTIIASQLAGFNALGSMLNGGLIAGARLMNDRLKKFTINYETKLADTRHQSYLGREEEHEARELSSANALRVDARLMDGLQPEDIIDQLSIVNCEDKALLQLRVNKFMNRYRRLSMSPAGELTPTAAPTVS